MSNGTTTSRQGAPGFLVLQCIVSAAETLMRLSANPPVERSGMAREGWTSTLIAYAGHERDRIERLEHQVNDWYEGEDLKVSAVGHLDAIGILSAVYAKGTVPEGFDDSRIVGAIMTSADALMAVAEQADEVLRSRIS